MGYLIHLLINSLGAKDFEKLFVSLVLVSTL